MRHEPDHEHEHEPDRPGVLVAIHDVAPRWLAEVQQLRSALARWGVTRATLLAVPHFHHQERLADHAPTVAWLRDCLARGDEVALHGYHHVQAGVPAPLRDRARAALWTAGEGECLCPEGELAELLERGRDQLTSCLQVRPAGFVAPAWLEPAGFAARLRGWGFAWHETSMYVEDLTTSRRLHAPAIGFATRSRLREALSIYWSRGLSAAARLAAPLRRAAVTRIAVHPADLSSPRVMAELQRVVRELASRGTTTTTIEQLHR